MSEKAYFLDDEDRTSINFNLTDEGLVIDIFDDEGEPLHTEGRTAQEWFDWMMEQMELREVNETYGVSHPNLVGRRTRNLCMEIPEVIYGPTIREGFWTVYLSPSTETLAYFNGPDAEEMAEDAAKRVAEAIGAILTREPDRNTLR